MVNLLQGIPVTLYERQKTGTESTAEEIAIACDLPAAKVRRLLELSPEVCSLNAPVGEGDAFGDLLEDIISPQPYEELVRDELSRTMEDLLGMLNERQQQTLRLRFGMIDGECHSLDEVGQILGVSKERARQIEKQAMDKLQQLGAGMGLEDFLNE